MKTFFKKIIVSILTLEAKILLKRMQPKIIAVTGSVGKTSTKDAIYTVLKDHVHTRKSQKSYNSELGVPLSILGINNAWNNPVLWLKNIFDGALTAFFSRDYPDVLILEMGVDRPGDMLKLTQWAKPDIVVLTRLPDVPVHVEYFATPEDVVAEKMQLVHALKEDGVFIYNNDDEKVRMATEVVRQQSFGYSRYAPSHFTISEDRIIYKDNVPAGVECQLEHVGEDVSFTVCGSLGVHQAYNFAAAIAVATQFEIPLFDAATALTHHVPPQGRMRLIAGKGEGVTIIDDTYNSSPVAVEQALQTLKEIKSTGKKIAVLGDMLELGRYSMPEHERMGELVARSADMLVTIGLRSRKIAEGALEHGMSEKVIFQYDDIARAGEELVRKISEDDVILVKASQSIRAEKLVKRLMKYPDQAKELLVRQSDQWLNR